MNERRQRPSFVSKVLTPRIPDSFNEGLLKGLVFGGFIVACIQPALSTHKQTNILAGGCLSISILLGLIGWAREEHFRGAGNRFNVHPLRRIRQSNFWHEAFERIRPVTRREGILKGFFLGFLSMLLMNVLQVVNPNYLSSMFVPVLAGILSGAVWGNYNQQHHPELPVRRFEA